MTSPKQQEMSNSATPRFRPVVRHTVPASIVRLIIAVVVVGLSFAVIGWQLPLALALLLSLGTLVFPKTPAAWLLAGLLAASALGGFGEAPGWKFFVVLAGAHALHLIGMTLGWLPVGGQVQLRILGRMLRTFLIIQVPAQAVALIVLTLVAGKSVASALTSPQLGLIAGVGFVLLVVVSVLSIARERPGG
jgi:hypothetical protein